MNTKLVNCIFYLKYISYFQILKNTYLIRSFCLFNCLRHCFSISIADFIHGVRSIKCQGETYIDAFITLIIKRSGEKIVKLENI